MKNKCGKAAGHMVPTCLYQALFFAQITTNLIITIMNEEIKTGIRNWKKKIAWISNLL